jgi:hypothetical protein
MHVSLVFGLASPFVETKLCFRPLPFARSAASVSFDRVAMGAAGLGDRQGRGASLLPNYENTPP